MAQHPLVILRDYWRIIGQQRRIVLFTVFMMGFFSFLFAQLYKPIPIYKTSSKVQVNSPQAVGDQLETQRAIITSYPVIQLAAGRLGYFKECRSKEDSTMQILFLESQIQTIQEGYTNIIGIEAIGRSPDEARDRADVVALIFAEYADEQKSELSRKQRLFIEQQREQARRDLQEKGDS